MSFARSVELTSGTQARRSRPLLGEVLTVGLLVACIQALCACGESKPGNPDAAPPNTCGNGVLEEWEDCETHDPHAGGDGCRNEPSCGNGVVDPDEVCDEGDLASGDGCGNQCRSDESCGNGIVDPGEQCDGDPGCTANCRHEPPPARCGNGQLDRGETCDTGDATDTRCDAACQVVDATAMSCGNGLLELGEQCDLGAATEPFTGCDDDCKLQQAFFITSLKMEPGHRGCDVVGPDGSRDNKDCRVDNVMGGFSALQEAMGLAFDFSIDQGGILALLIIEGTADATGQAPSNINAYLLDGVDGDHDKENNDDGGTPFWISGQDIGPSGQPEEGFGGTMENGWFSLASPRFSLNIGFNPERIPCEFVDAWIRGVVRHDGWRMTEVSRGWLCGAVTARSLTVLQNPDYLDIFQLFLKRSLQLVLKGALVH